MLLEDDFSYGVATDKRHLKTMSDRAKSAVSTGSVDTSAHVKVDDFEAGKLLSQARVKVIPFLDTHEAAPINELVTMLESGDGDKTELKERLRKALAAFSYLL